ncbi:hypothetical protein BB8028_0001g10570 [Beauveria bassiana]|uniref:Uncharacterized protein n=1 Tax=Beauveria bassiana TaxID=176275 RepID=A0A2S7XYK4_BEABA|nr:hypothetical protein BB8028_0001g10570 [Beauveria bassiana]
MQESAALRYDVPDALQSTNVQLVTAHEIALGQENGGNAVWSMCRRRASFLACHDNGVCARSRRRGRLRRRRARIHARLGIARQGELRVWTTPFIYPNYAAPRAGRVLPGTRRSRLERLLEIQSRYDPERIFANLQPEHLTLHDKRRKR